MRKHMLLPLSLAFFSLSACCAIGAEASAPAEAPAKADMKADAGGMPPADRDWTLQEARKYAHERVLRAQKFEEKVSKMNEAEWAEHEKRHRALKEKLAKMTPEERAAYRKEHFQHLDDSTASASSATPAAGATKP